MLTGSNEGVGDRSSVEGANAADKNIPAAITDTGCERDLNEDRYAVIESPSGLMWLVCDGMGGVAGGELAAQLAVDAIKRDLEGFSARPLVTATRNAFMEANRVIVLRRQNQAFSQMGTTAVAVTFSGIELAIGWVGDSRAYLIRDGEIELLTKDHTYVQQLVDEGKIMQEDALSHPDAHILTRCIGAEPGLKVDVQKYWLWETVEGAPNDIVVLCSDGLYSEVTDDELAEIVNNETPQRACVKLVDLAKERGGFDNITVAIIPVGGQVRQEPPAGYDEMAAVRMRRQKMAKNKESKGSWGKTLLGAFLLSVFAAMIVVVAVIFFVSR